MILIVNVEANVAARPPTTVKIRLRMTAGLLPNESEYLPVRLEPMNMPIRTHVWSRVMSYEFKWKGHRISVARKLSSNSSMASANCVIPVTIQSLRINCLPDTSVRIWSTVIVVGLTAWAGSPGRSLSISAKSKSLFNPNSQDSARIFYPKSPGAGNV